MTTPPQPAQPPPPSSSPSTPPSSRNQQNQPPQQAGKATPRLSQAGRIQAWTVVPCGEERAGWTAALPIGPGAVGRLLCKSRNWMHFAPTSTHPCHRVGQRWSKLNYQPLAAGAQEPPNDLALRRANRYSGRCRDPRLASTAGSQVSAGNR